MEYGLVEAYRCPAFVCTIILYCVDALSSLPVLIVLLLMDTNAPMYSENNQASFRLFLDSYDFWVQNVEKLRILL